MHARIRTTDSPEVARRRSRAAALLVAAALAGMIVLYNAALKRVPVAGICAMGLCRGLSLLLGAVAARPEFFARLTATDMPVFLAAGGLTLYVTGLSAVAKREA